MNIGFCGLLTVLFIGLKLGGVIAWSWWWVLSPLWIPAVVVLAILALALMADGARLNARAKDSGRRW